MLEQIRRNVRHPYIQALLGAVIIVFIFFFGWSMRSQKPAWVAQVNGEAIEFRPYQQAYNGLIRIYQEAFKDDFGPERLRQLNLGRRAIDQLVDQTLLLQDADLRDLEVSNAELEAAIQSVSVFQGDGGFSKDLYFQVLDANRLTPLEYEQSKRQELLLGKVEQAIRAEATVTETAVENEFRDRNTQAKIAYVAFRPAAYEMDVGVDEEKLNDFYSTEQEAFRTPEQRSARYVLFTPEPFLDAVTATEEEIRQEYTWRAEEFAQPEAVHARHILLRVPPGASAAVEEELRTKAVELRTQLQEGADFAELARTHSDDPGTRENGGDLGFFERGRMVPPFEEAAFSLEPGTISEPVRTSFGFHLIEVLERREATTPSLEEVSAQLAADIKRRKALEEAYAAADNTLMDLEDGVVDWEGLAEQHSVETTPLVEPGAPVPAVENGPAFSEALFGLDPDTAGQLLETPAGTYLLAVAQVQPTAVPPLDEVRDEVEQRFRKAEAQRVAAAAAEEFLTAVAADGWEEALTAQGFTAEVTEAFAKKGGAVPKLGWAPELKDALFGLDEAGQWLPQPQEVNGVYYAVQLAELQEPDMEALEAERENLRQELLPRVQDEYLENYLAELRDKAEIEINTDLLY